MNTESCVINTPIGPFEIRAEGNAIVYADFSDSVTMPPQSNLLREAAKQLDEYFIGECRSFDLPLRPAGTPFQTAVWQGLLGIPYGETVSYGQLAALIGRPGAARAVGGANRVNPLPVFIPCHRVIAADRKLGGFSCGLWRKEFLLKLERAIE